MPDEFHFKIINGGGGTDSPLITHEGLISD